MTNPSDPWDKVNQIIKRQENPVAKPLPSDRPLAGIEEQAEATRQKALGIIGRFQSGQVVRKAALEELKAIQNTHLEATKHALKQALAVDKQRVDLIAKKYIYQITEEYLRDMQTLGMQNYQARMTTLMRLNEETSRLLAQADAQNVPDRLKDITIEAILKKHREFYDSLTKE
jgi:isocitrate dehydrogenase